MFQNNWLKILIFFFNSLKKVCISKSICHMKIDFETCFYRIIIECIMNLIKLQEIIRTDKVLITCKNCLEIIITLMIRNNSWESLNVIRKIVRKSSHKVVKCNALPFIKLLLRNLALFEDIVQSFLSRKWPHHSLWDNICFSQESNIRVKFEYK